MSSAADSKANKDEPSFSGRLQPVKSTTSAENGSRIISGTQLEGDHGKLERNFSALSSLGLAFALLNSWTAMSASLGIILPSGGAVAMVWGLVCSAIGSLCMAASLAELCHVWPTTGGQFDWTFLLAPSSYRVGLSFFEGWMAVAGWISLAATGSSLGANFVVELIALWDANYEAESWHIFLVYVGFTLGACCLNIFGVRILPHVDTAAFAWSLTGLVMVTITVLATSRGEYQPASFVFGGFENTTGWPDGWAFILGLLQSTFGLTGFDAVSHMIEEMPHAAVTAPRVMVAAVLMGACTSWIFLVVLLFCLRDFDEVISSSAGSLITIYFQATSSRAGATCLTMFNVVAMCFATQGLMTAASRMVLSFARDRGFGRLSEPLSRVHPTIKAPVWAVVFTSVWVIIFGCVFLGSEVALNAILSASVVMLQTSYIVPIALIFWRGESGFDLAQHGTRKLSLGRFRRPINFAALCFALLTTVAFLFPPATNPTGSSMNYVIVVVGIVLILLTATWFIDGRVNFRGPSDMDTRLEEAARLSNEEDSQI